MNMFVHFNGFEVKGPLRVHTFYKYEDPTIPGFNEDSMWYPIARGSDIVKRGKINLNRMTFHDKFKL